MGSVGGGQGGCKWRSEAFVKIQKIKKNIFIFFEGGGVGSGGGGGGVGGEEGHHRVGGSGWM